jgi:two-component system, cell cycle sensor histidine kinase and response regulator CckA
MRPGSFFDDLERAPARIAGTYAFVGGGWILVSDLLAAFALDKPAAHLWADLAKGWLFIAATAGLVFLLARRAVARELAVRRDMAASQERFQSAATQFPFTFAICDAERRVVFLNARGAQLVGQSAGEALGRRFEEVFPLPLANACRPALDRALETRRPQSEVVEAELGRTAAQLAVTFTPILDAGGAVRELHLVFNDLTSVVQVERRVRRLNRSLQAVSAANSVLVRSTSEAELLQGFCNALLGPTGHRLAWVGLVTPGEPNVRVAAHAGPADGYLDGIHIRCDDTPEGRGPTGLAIRTGQPQVCHDFTADERMAPWRERAALDGLRSAIALPLRAREGVLGAFTLYSSEPNRFDDEEVKLLLELAEDLAFGVTALRHRVELARATASLRTLKLVVEQSPSVAYVARNEPGWPVEFVSDNISRYGYAPERLVEGELDFADLLFPEDQSQITTVAEAASTAGWQEFTHEYRIVDAAGRAHWVRDCCALERDAAGAVTHFRGVVTDITERKQADALVTASELKFRRLFEAAQDGILLLDAVTGQVTDVNPYLERLLGHPREHFLRQHVWELGCFRHTLANREKFAELQRDNFVRYEDLPLQAADGREIQVEFISNAYLVGDQRVIQCDIRDVSDRKRAEARHQESEARLALALDAGQLGTYDYDLPANHIVWSRWHELLWGFQPGEFGGTYQAFESRVHPEDLPGLNAEVRRCIAEQAIFTREFRVVWPDGSVHWIVGRGRFTFDAEGRPLRMHGVVQERTAQKRAEVQIRDALAYLGAVIDASPVGLISYDADGQAQTANEAAARIVGATEERLLAQNFRHIESWRAAGLLAAAERALERRQPERIEAHFTSIFGKELWVAAQFVPFQRGTDWHLLLMLSDISEREQAMAQLGLQSAALEAAANAIVITNAQGVIEWVNAAFTLNTGYAREEVVGKNPRLLKSGRHPHEFYEGLWRTILAGHVWHGEMHNVRKNGSPLEEEATITPVKDAAGRITHFIAIKQDITDRKSLEKQLLRAQRMEGIGLLAGGIAHDLNNVLAPILMGADLLKLTAPDEQAARQLDGIVQSAKRGADIVRQVLTFARGIEGERIPIQPKHVIKEMVRMARETFPRNLQFSVDIPADLWPIVGDPTQLHQVLLNLSVNARDAMPDGGTLTYGARNAEVDALLAAANPGAKPGPHVVLRVQDSGTGIAPEVMERIFEPFFTTKELGKGTGLGLSTVIGIVRSHGGFVTVESQVGQGTAFEVWLPANPQATQAVQVVEAEPLPRGHGELVLVVDDEADILRVTRAMLEGHGYRVLTAGDGTQALTELSQHLAEVRLVVTDILMPFMDGVQLLHALRRMAPELKVIASSGALGMPGQKDRTDEVKALGVKHILHKPYSVEQLLRAVQAELHGDAARP